jgi:hypothetical protein
VASSSRSVLPIGSRRSYLSNLIGSRFSEFQRALNYLCECYYQELEAIRSRVNQEADADLHREILRDGSSHNLRLLDYQRQFALEWDAKNVLIFSENTAELGALSCQHCEKLRLVQLEADRNPPTYRAGIGLRHEEVLERLREEQRRTKSRKGLGCRESARSSFL